MPQVIGQDLKKLLLELLNGAATAPATIYVGLIGGRKPLPADTLASLSAVEVNAAGYARKAVTVGVGQMPDSSFQTNDWAINFASQVMSSFTGGGSQPVGDHLFLTDQASGFSGKLYLQAPLNPYATPLSTTTTSTTTSGQAIIALVSVVGLNVDDYLLVDSVASGIQEWLRILSIAGNNVTMASSFANTHTGSGIVVTQDGLKRTYQAGSAETVTPKIQLVQG